MEVFSKKIGRYSFYVLMIFILAFCGKEQKESTSSNGSEAIRKKTPPLFTLLPASETNVAFVNELTEGLNTNILMYEYFYNGGGVAAGDLNGDDLIDLYFTSNMGDNKLYLNKGNMKFEDITELSGAGGRPGPWKTGVTIADVNGDGRPDIFVCYSGMMPDEKRVNQLFINQGNNEQQMPLFKDEAKAMGLAGSAFSNQAYFFDYDRDGDLDALLLNHNPRSLPVLNEVMTAKMIALDDPNKGVRLFRQQNGRFEDVTKRAGISSSELTYGLAIGVSDIDGDRWPDFYISNDYAVPDYLYINNRDGTFTDRLGNSVMHNSQFSMGNDIADINNDGLPDIITLDMLPEDNRRQKLLLAPDNYAKFDLNVRSGFHYQYMRNMLQLNNGNGTFSEIGQKAGIATTDWSWAALAADFDNDGLKDLFVTNGYFRDYTNLDFIKYMDDYVKSSGRLQREDVLKIIAEMPSSNVKNYVFRNTDGTSFSNHTDVWGMNRPSNSNGAAYADLDNDGDLDLVVNNINLPAFIYRNDASTQTKNHFLQVKLKGEGKNTLGIGAKVCINAGGKLQQLEQAVSRGYLSAVSPVLHFGLGESDVIDTLSVTWPGGKEETLVNIQAGQVLTLSEKNARTATKARTVSRSTDKPFAKKIDSPIDHRDGQVTVNDFKRQPLLTSALSCTGPVIIKGDVNDDRLDDVYIGGQAGQAGVVYLRQQNGTFRKKVSSSFENDRSHADAAAAFLDANGDGHRDLYVASGGYHNLDADDPLLNDRLYLNDGKGNFVRSPDALPQMSVSKGCVAVGDVNNDGHPDLFVGGRVIPGRYPETPESFLLLNDGKGHFENSIGSYAPGLQRAGMITSAQWTDVDSDGLDDLIVAGEYVPLSIYINDRSTLRNRTTEYLEGEYSGWWNTLIADDLNNDGQPDIIAGNTGENIGVNATATYPVEMYYKDFDDNGSVDPFLCTYIQGRSYPFVTRDELLEQIGSMRSRFNSYKSYADVTLQDIFGEETLAQAGRLSANHFRTTLLMSTADGRYVVNDLPDEVQYAPVHAIIVADFTNDDNKDLLFLGNNNHFKLRLGRADANYGILVRGNSDGTFDYIPQPLSGFTVRGDVRSAVMVGNQLLLGINQDKIVAYEISR